MGDVQMCLELTILLSPKSNRVLGHAILDLHDGNKTYVIGPFNPRLELGQAEMNLNTEHDRPVRFPTLTRHGLGARSQRGQISSHETQRREVV